MPYSLTFANFEGALQIASLKEWYGFVLTFFACVDQNGQALWRSEWTGTLKMRQQILVFMKSLCLTHAGPDSSVGRVSAPGNGRSRFNPGPRHTKVSKNGTSFSSLGTQTYEVELGLVDSVSGKCDWVWYHVKCLGHDTSVRQLYKSKHWAPCRNQIPSWYDRKIVESDIKPEQTNNFWHIRPKMVLAQNWSVAKFKIRQSLPATRKFVSYRDDPKFSDIADPDQTAPRGAVWSGSTLFAIPAASFGCITLR